MEKFTSRKFIVTILAMVTTGILAYFGKMTGDTALVLSAGIASYNWANAKLGSDTSKGL